MASPFRRKPSGYPSYPRHAGKKATCGVCGQPLRAGRIAEHRECERKADEEFRRITTRKEAS